MASVFNGKEKVKTKNAQHKLGERKRSDDEMKFNLTAEGKGNFGKYISERMKLHTVADEPENTATTESDGG